MKAGTHLVQHFRNLKKKTLIPIKEAAFYRGGTSKGLLISSSALFRFDQNARDRILCKALGSPDPDGRQIDGLGGGTSSTSKVAILSKVDSIYDRFADKLGHPFPLGAGAKKILESSESIADKADIVYRFGQVSIKGDNEIDWGSTCGNMVSAAAHYAIRQSLYVPELAKYFTSQDQLSPSILERLRNSFDVTVRVLAHDSGKIIKVHTRAEFVRLGKGIHVQPIEHGDVSIAGVPGTASGIVVETPLQGGSVLSTGNEKDTIEVDGKQIEVSIVNTGLPVVFVHANSLGIPISDLTQHPASIDANKPLIELLERVRHAACQLTPQLQSTYSKPSPKLCVIHEPVSYTTTGRVEVDADEMDIFIRVLSSGQLHRTVPATTLSATAAAKCHEKTIVAELVRKEYQGGRKVPENTQSLSNQISRILSINGNHNMVTVGQPAGLTSTCVEVNEKTKEPMAVFDVRSARQIMYGNITVPYDVEPGRDLASSLSGLEGYREISTNILDVLPEGEISG
ncbi:hypothetical protein L7F22_003214 [Adiantum nelumboides]|nr:hypothetical protein [Adiantum nelumboides]